MKIQDVRKIYEMVLIHFFKCYYVDTLNKACFGNSFLVSGQIQI